MNNENTMLRAIIIDDMPQAVQLLRADLREYCPEVEVIGDAEGVVSGARLIKELKPNLLFLDIQLKDGTGFDLLEILPDGPDFQVIFTTVSDAHAIRAFRYAAIDYLLKPLDPEELQEAVQKAAQLAGQQDKGQLGLLLDAVKQPTAPRRIVLHTQEKIQVVNVEDIVRCEASSNYTTFFFTDGSKLLVSKTLKEFEKLLQDHPFLRVHQSHLANLQHVKAFLKTEGGYLQMQDGALVPVSFRKRQSVLEALEGLG